MWMPGGMWGMGWGFGMIVVIVFWALVIAAVVWIVRSAAERRAYPGGRVETPLEILQRRYASGEIGRDEYEQKRRDLGGSIGTGDQARR